MHEPETPVASFETFELVDGDLVADVAFVAGTYTLEQIVERVNAESKTVSARVADGKIRLKHHKVTSLQKGRAVGYSMSNALGKLIQLGHDYELKDPAYGGNRHERRKQRALTQRMATQKRLQGH